jgi:predicted Zn-dependent protease
MRIVSGGARRRMSAVALAASLVASGCAPAITTQQEVQIGRQYAAEINRQLPIVQNSRVHGYINQLGESIARRVDPRGLDYTFYVVNSDAVNAFAVPGGFIYVNRGLIERADNMSELAGVLAHEIGHVVERHSVEQIQKAQNANLLGSLVYGVLLGRQPSTVERVGLQGVGSAVFAGYSRDAEREADVEAVGYLVRSGIDPRGLPSFFRELLEERQRRPSSVEQWFSTHPLTEERIDNAQRIIAALPAGTLQGLATDTRDYQNFRSQVRQLPAAPQPRR